MTADPLKIYDTPQLTDPRLVLGFSGWMDGGEVSTGTVDYLVETLQAKEIAEIDGGDFYIFNFPGSMDVSSVFRPHTRIADGLITTFQEPRNAFFCDEANNLVLFLGKEPNVKWKDYGRCIFALADRFGVEMIYFVGSVAGLVPHTREPRFFGSVSNTSLKTDLEPYRLRFTNYEGPASIVTYLMAHAPEAGVRLAGLVAEIPAYIQGRNVKCIQAMVRKLAAILTLDLDLEILRIQGEELEKKINQIVQDRPELAGHIAKLEEDYDNEVFDTQMGDLKDWLEEQGISLD